MTSRTPPWPPVAPTSSYLRAQFNRLATRRGLKKAVVAVAESILTTLVSFCETAPTRALTISIAAIPDLRLSSDQSLFENGAS